MYLTLLSHPAWLWPIIVFVVFAVSGVKEVDQVLNILLTTNMFVGGFLGFFLDNTIPGRLIKWLCLWAVGCGIQVSYRSLYVFIGSKSERGLRDREYEDVSDKSLASLELYDLPFGLTTFLSSRSWVRYIPFCPWRDKSDDKTVNNAMLRRGSELLSQGEDICDESVWKYIELINMRILFYVYIF